MFKKVPKPEGAVWPQGRPKPPRKAAPVRPFPLARGSKFADPRSSAPIILHPLHPNRSRRLPPEQSFPPNPGPRGQGAPPPPTVGITQPRAHSCGEVCSEPGSRGPPDHPTPPSLSSPGCWAPGPRPRPENQTSTNARSERGFSRPLCPDVRLSFAGRWPPTQTRSPQVRKEGRPPHANLPPGRGGAPPTMPRGGTTVPTMLQGADYNPRHAPGRGPALLKKRRGREVKLGTKLARDYTTHSVPGAGPAIPTMSRRGAHTTQPAARWPCRLPRDPCWTRTVSEGLWKLTPQLHWSPRPCGLWEELWKIKQIKSNCFVGAWWFR